MPFPIEVTTQLLHWWSSKCFINGLKMQYLCTMLIVYLIHKSISKKIITSFNYTFTIHNVPTFYYISNDLSWLQCQKVSLYRKVATSRATRLMIHNNEDEQHRGLLVQLHLAIVINRIFGEKGKRGEEKKAIIVT